MTIVTQNGEKEIKKGVKKGVCGYRGGEEIQLFIMCFVFCCLSSKNKYTKTSSKLV